MEWCHALNFSLWDYFLITLVKFTTVNVVISTIPGYNLCTLKKRAEQALCFRGNLYYEMLRERQRHTHTHKKKKRQREVLGKRKLKDRIIDAISRPTDRQRLKLGRISTWRLNIERKKREKNGKWEYVKVPWNIKEKRWGLVIKARVLSNLADNNYATSVMTQPTMLFRPTTPKQTNKPYSC